MDQASEYLSNNIRDLRRKAGLSQDMLSKISSVPRSSIAYIESATGNPSLGNLLRLAAALNVGVDELLTKPRARVQRYTTEEIVKTIKPNLIMVEKLLPDSIPGMEIDRLTFPPETRLKGVPHTIGTKEYLTVIRGSITVFTEGERFVVNRNQVLAFPGDEPHSYFNPGKSEAVLISVVALTPRHS